MHSSVYNLSMWNMKRKTEKLSTLAIFTSEITRRKKKKKKVAEEMAKIMCDERKRYKSA
jgi:hypothetical protein